MKLKFIWKKGNLITILDGFNFGYSLQIPKKQIYKWDERMFMDLYLKQTSNFKDKKIYIFQWLLSKLDDNVQVFYVNEQRS